MRRRSIRQVLKVWCSCPRICHGKLVSRITALEHALSQWDPIRHGWMVMECSNVSVPPKVENWPTSQLNIYYENGHWYDATTHQIINLPTRMEMDRQRRETMSSRSLFVDDCDHNDNYDDNGSDANRIDGDDDEDDDDGHNAAVDVASALERAIEEHEEEDEDTIDDDNDDLEEISENQWNVNMAKSMSKLLPGEDDDNTEHTGDHHYNINDGIDDCNDIKTIDEDSVPDNRRMFLLMLYLWCSAFNISKRAMTWLMKILAIHIPELTPYKNLVRFRRTIGVDVQYDRYVVCTGCAALYDYKKCYRTCDNGEVMIQNCTNRVFPHHQQTKSRKECGTLLLTEKVNSRGEILYKPLLIFPYHPLIPQLKRILCKAVIRTNINKWRQRHVLTDDLHDIYDGTVWKTWCTNGFLKGANNLLLALNLDWYQPFNHVPYSVGVIYVTILNLPRRLRLHKSNIIVLGILPGGRERDHNMDQYLLPLVAELQLLWQGLNLKNAVRPKYRYRPPYGPPRAPSPPPAVPAPDHDAVSSMPSMANRSVKAVDNVINAGDEKRSSSSNAPVPLNHTSSSTSSPSFDHNYRAALILVVADMPAARKFCGFMGHAGIYGCSSCLREFKHVPDGDKKTKDGKQKIIHDWSKASEMGTPRTIEQHRIDSAKWKAATTNTLRSECEKKEGHGVKWSPLNDLPYWDPTTAMIIDPMHNFWLGVVRDYMNHLRGQWTDKQLLLIQQRLDSMAPPRDCGRILRQFAANMSNLTAHQVMTFTSTFSSIVLRGDLLHATQQQIWQRLVICSRLLQQHTISQRQLDELQQNITEAVKLMEVEMGSHCMKPNHHMSVHLVECLRRFGPAPAIGTWAYERMNHQISLINTNTINIEQQIMNSVIEHQQLVSMVDIYEPILNDDAIELMRGLVQTSLRHDNANGIAPGLSIDTTAVEYTPSRSRVESKEIKDDHDHDPARHTDIVSSISFYRVNDLLQRPTITGAESFDCQLLDTERNRRRISIRTLEALQDKFHYDLYPSVSRNHIDIMEYTRLSYRCRVESTVYSSLHSRSERSSWIMAQFGRDYWVGQILYFLSIDARIGDPNVNDAEVAQWNKYEMAKVQWHTRAVHHGHQPPFDPAERFNYVYDYETIDPCPAYQCYLPIARIMHRVIPSIEPCITRPSKKNAHRPPNHHSSGQIFFIAPLFTQLNQ